VGVVQAVVVGAGVFGTWTAHHLQRAGAQVTLIDAYGPANSRSSSGDETRILRCGYGPDRIYTDLAAASLPQWKALEARGGGEPLWHPSGVLWLAAGHDAYTEATRSTLEGAGHRLSVFDHAGVRRRFPQFDPDGIATALFEPDVGVLAARRAVRALASILRVAESLDRSHAQVISGLELRPRADDLLMLLHADGDAELEIWATNRHLQPFERLMGRPVRLIRE
jgi:glycine/D-amino acid oxidase-like deaminating enzyme